MELLRVIFRAVLPTAFAAGFIICLHSAAQNPAEGLLRKQQNWQIKCYDKGCLASVDILRGVSDDPPSPRDVNQYISVAVGVDNASQKATLVMFEVDPDADRPAGIDLLFARTEVQGKEYKPSFDSEGLIHLPFTKCDRSTCTAAIGGGNPDEATLKAVSEMVARMQTHDHLLLAYTRQNHLYRTAISLKLFRDAYDRALADVKNPQSSNGPKR